MMTDDFDAALELVDLERRHQRALHKIDVLEDMIDKLNAQIKKDALQYLSDVGQMQDTIADLNATLEQIPDHAYNAGMLKGILVGIVDWAYHQENKPEWLDGAEGILRKVKDD